MTQDYVFHRILGEGHYGKVRRAMNKLTQERVAIKSIPKARVRNLENLRREVNILQDLHHPNVIRFIDVYEDALAVHLVMELCTGGELFDRIASEKSFSEAKASMITRQIFEAVAYLHGKGIVHRDLKPENIMFLNETDNIIKLCDFGLSRIFNSKSNDVMHTRAGTAYYMAPELLQRNYTEKCDIWSVGCIVYIMLCGYPPFFAESEAEVFKLILKGQLDFAPPEWDSISESARVFLRKVLCTDPVTRPSAAECLEQPWLTLASSTEISHQTLTSLKSFYNASRLKQKMFSEMAKQLSTEEISNLQAEFKKMDLNHDGVLSADEILKAMQQLDPAARAGLDALTRRLKEFGDLHLDWNTFCKAAADRREYLRKERVAEIFNQIDVDRSGKLSIAEITSAFGLDKNDPKLLEEILRLDTNHDGELDLDEIMTMLKE